MSSRAGGASGITFLAVSLLVCLSGTARTARAETDKKDTTKKTWAVDASHGTYGDSIAIEVPAFREITPELALSYDSSDGNGELGVGWSLDGVGVIERATPGKGAPRYDASDIFLLDGEELVPCAPDSPSPSCKTGGTHSTKLESYQRIALTGSGADSRWTITGKDGVRHVYAPVFSLSGGADVFRWGLQQVVDTVGNAVTYAWGNDQLGCCWEYPASVSYGSTTITFRYQARPDVEVEAVGKGSLRTAHGRLATIDVTVGGSRLRAYQLSYTQSGATSRSLLSSVRQYGKDATLDDSGTVTGGTSLPAVLIDYQAGAPAFAAGSHDLVVSGGADAQFFAIDIDGDGRSDMLELYPSLGSTRRRTWISDGIGFTQTSDDSGMSGSTDSHFLTMDVDGDGRSDVVELYPGLLDWNMRTWISNGAGFDEASSQSTGHLYSADAKFHAMDIDGDGRSDILELYPSWGSYRRTSWISTGDGFTEGADEDGIGFDSQSRFYPMDVDGDGRSDLLELFQSILGLGRRIWRSDGDGFTAGATDYIVHSADDELIPMDINGDGKTDLLQIHPFASINYRRAWLSTGDSFTLASDEAGGLFSSNNWYVAVDVNGDGKSDLIEMEPYAAGFYGRQIWLSVGGGFVAGAHDVDMGYSGESTKMMAADVDGDGLSEMIELYPATVLRGRRVWSIAAGTYPDLLESVKNSLGRTTSVTYAPSSAWENTNNPPLMQTVTTVTGSDGRGRSVTTHYEYAGGLQDRAEKRFLGFRQQVETLPCIDGESTCPTVETLFRQDHGAASRPERVDLRAGDGELLRSEVHEYTTNGDALPWTALRTGSWKYLYANGGTQCPGADCQRTYASRTFDAYGEVTLQVDHGDYDLAGDETTSRTTFVPNTTAYMVDHPAQVETFEGEDESGALLQHTRYHYDGAKTWEQAPSAGLLTTTARWLSEPSSFIETHREYDAWGNATADIDALGARTERTFDSTHHLFVTSAANAIGQGTTSTWDVVCGAPTETTDLDGQPTRFTYDDLCRMTEKIAPGGRFERHSWAKLGDAMAQYELVETPGAGASDGPMWTRSYFDGYRRVWRSVSRGPDAATGDIHVDTTYAARGQVASVTAAYYWVAGKTQPETYATTSSYDALDRLTRVTYPDGAYATKEHGLRSVTDTDPLGHARTDHFDAHGRRIAHDELVGDAVQTTRFLYDARGNLTETIDPLDNRITYVTDSLGRKTKQSDPDWGTWTYEYDAAGRLTAQTDAKEQRTELAHDALGRKTEKTTLAGTDAAVTVSWTYDEVREGHHNIGHLTTQKDGAGSETLDHDVAGNVVRSVRTIFGDSYTFEHGFDEGDRRLWTKYPDGDTLGTPESPLAYDGAGRLASIPGYVGAARYAADGSLLQLENSNGTVTSRAYAPERGWLSGISTSSMATTVQDVGFARDAKGKITEISSPFDNEGWSYDYDELDRVTAARNSSSSEHDQTFEYDAIGNITYNSRFGSYTYDSARPHAVTGAGSETYTYDAGGLMTGGRGRSLGWDGDNRLASLARGPRGAAAAATLTDGGAAGCRTVAGRRAPAWGWVWLASLLGALRLLRGSAQHRPATRVATATAALAALALLAACAGDPSGRPGAQGSDDGPRVDDESALSMTFTYDANGARIQQVERTITRRHLGDGYEIEVGGPTVKYVSLGSAMVARKEGDKKTWVHTDHLASIQAETDDTGAVVHRQAYRPFGEVLSREGELDGETRGFTGQRLDASDLLFLHARYYDPALGRFISPDFIVDGSDTVGLNRYAYVGNDPINHDDVDGTCKDGGCLGSRLKDGAKVVGRGARNTLIGAGAAASIVGASMEPLAVAGPPGVFGTAFGTAQMNVIEAQAAKPAQTALQVGDAATPPASITQAQRYQNVAVDLSNMFEDLADAVGRKQPNRPGALPKPATSGAGPGPKALPGVSDAGNPGRWMRGARFLKFAGPVGGVVTVGLAVNDFRTSYNESRQSGDSKLRAIGSGTVNAALGLIGGPEVLHGEPSEGGLCGRAGRCR